MKKIIAAIRSRLGNEHGFGFAELMISTSILFMSVLSFTSLMGSSLEFTGSMQTKTLAYNLVTQTIEQIKDRDYNAVEGFVSTLPATVPIGNYTLTRTVSVAAIDKNGDGTPDYKQVTVTVGWTKPHPGSYSATTYINSFTVAPGTPSPPVDTTPPDVQITAPSPDGTINGTPLVTATGNDAYGVSKIEIYNNDTTSSPVLLYTGTMTPSPGSASVSYNWDTTKYVDGLHNLMAKAYDAAGNVGTSPSVGYIVVNSPNSDNIPPTAPIDLTAEQVVLKGQLTNQIKLTWLPATDNIGVKWYRVDRHNYPSGTHDNAWYTTSLSYLDTVNSTSTVYQYRIQAVDGAGNQGPSSNWAIPSPTGYPSTPTYIAKLYQDAGSVNFQWGASTDSSYGGYITAYKIYNNGTLIQTISSPSPPNPIPPTFQATENFTGGNNSWNYTITAVDNIGLESRPSIIIDWNSP